MRAARRRLSKRHFRPTGTPHDCGSSSERFRQMWERSHPDDLPDLHGPQEVKRVLDESEMREAIRDLVQRFRHLCLHYGKHTEISVSTIGRDEIEEQLHQLSTFFYFKDSKTVCQFLTHHRSLIPVLFEARKKFNQYFGPDSP